MSEQIRRLLASRKFENLQVPAGFDKNIGATTQRVPVTGNQPYDMSDLEAEVLGRKPKAKFVPQRGASEPAVEQAGFDLVARFQKAAEQLGTKKKGVDPLAPLAEHVAIVARNARDGGDGTPTVLADTAAALLAVDDSTRDMILRRAGNPPEFEALRNSGLAEPPAQQGMQLFGQDVTVDDPKAVQRGEALESARSRVDAEDAAIKAASTVERFPAIKRFGSHFSGPDRLDKKGNVRKAKEVYKDYLPKNRSPEGVTAASADSTKRAALQTLAGDQIGQIKKIEKKTGGPALLPPAVPAKKGEPAQSRDRTLSIGTDQNYWRARDKAAAGPGQSGATTDKTVSYRSKGMLDRNLEELYRLTQPQPVSDPSTGAIQLTSPSGKAMKFAEPADSVIDLDKHFPWWRGRFAVLDEKGKLTYPKQLPSAEFVTGLIESTHGVTDAGFFDRVLPLIQRSIDAAPEVPDPNVRPERGRTAHDYSQTVFLPSPSFINVMKQGVGSPDMPYSIYGPRQVERPDVTPPQRHPFSGKSAVDPAAEEGKAQLRRLLGEPGLGDQSSIYKMPPNSPMRLLLA